MHNAEAIEYRGHYIVKDTIALTVGEPLPRTPGDLTRFAIIEITEGRKASANYAPSEQAARAKIDDMIERRARSRRSTRRQEAIS